MPISLLMFAVVDAAVGPMLLLIINAVGAVVFAYCCCSGF